MDNNETLVIGDYKTSCVFGDQFNVFMPPTWGSKTLAVTLLSFPRYIRNTINMKHEQICTTGKNTKVKYFVNVKSEYFLVHHKYTQQDVMVHSTAKCHCSSGHGCLREVFAATTIFAALKPGACSTSNSIRECLFPPVSSY